ncbi:type II secretion system F family protein [Candidatus Woesearchaeota archaeon]|nr:type II secretion system F family protein [Candidatus Woesearchaeota archaeon]
MKTIERLFLPLMWIKYFEDSLKLAGVKKSLAGILKIFLIADFILSFLILIVFKDLFQYYKSSSAVLSFLSYYVLVFFGFFILFMVIFYSWVAYTKVMRKNEIEAVLGDYFQLVAANVGAGMTIDQALLYSIRGRFGRLADDMQTVSKRVMAGVSLDKALMDFASSYESNILEKSMILLVESLESGGEVAGLINKIAWNIRQNQIMKQEISSSVTTYSIFIGFAALAAAPMLFALSHRIIIVMGDLTSNLDLSSAAGVSTKLPIHNIGSGIGAGEFKLFAFASLFFISIFASMIISLVRKGNIKEGLKSIPIFVFVSIGLFLIFSVILTSLFASVGI